MHRRRMGWCRRLLRSTRCSGQQYPIYDDSPEWGSASVLATWRAYQFYGDVAELVRAYPTMQRYVAFLEGKAKDGIVDYGLGDWYDIGPGAPGS